MARIYGNIYYKSTLIAGNSHNETISSEARNGTFNDYPFMGVHSSEWKWVAPEMGEDIV